MMFKRLNLLIPAIALAAALSAQAGPATRPTQITLNLANAPAARAVAELSKQAGVPLPLFPPDLLTKSSLPNVTLDVARVPFWQALRDISRQSGLEPVTNAEEPYPRFMLGLGTGKFWQSPHAVAGPLLLIATDVSRSSTVDLGRTRHNYQRDLNVGLMALSEPGVRLLSISTNVTLISAVDDLGQSLAPVTNQPVPNEAEIQDGARGGEMGSLYMTHLSVALSCPEKRGKTIAKLKARTAVRIQTGTQRVEFDDILNSKTRGQIKPAGNFPVTMKSFKKADIEYVLSLSLKREKRSPEEWINLSRSIYNGQLALYDARGRMVAGRATENGGDYNANRIEANLRFVREPGLTEADAGEPFKLVWDAPTASQDLNLDFELTGIPIPR